MPAFAYQRLVLKLGTSTLTAGRPRLASAQIVDLVRAEPGVLHGRASVRRGSQVHGVGLVPGEALFNLVDWR